MMGRYLGTALSKFLRSEAGFVLMALLFWVLILLPLRAGAEYSRALNSTS